MRQSYVLHLAAC